MDERLAAFALIMLAARVADVSRVAVDFGGMTGLFFGIGGGAPRPLFTGFTFACKLLFCARNMESNCSINMLHFI